MAATTHAFGTTFGSTNGMSMTLYPSALTSASNIYFQIQLMLKKSENFSIEIKNSGKTTSSFELSFLATEVTSDTIAYLVESVTNITDITVAFNQNVLTLTGIIGTDWLSVAKILPQEWMTITCTGYEQSIEWFAINSNIQDATPFMYFDLTRPIRSQQGILSVVIPVNNPPSESGGIFTGSFYVTSHLTREEYTLNVFNIENVWTGSSHCAWGGQLWSIYFNQGWMQPVQANYFIGNSLGLSESNYSSAPFMDVIDIFPYYNATSTQCQ